MVMVMALRLAWVCGLLCAGLLRAQETINYLPEIKDGKCIFPFQYRNGFFYDCLQFGTKHPWCSLNSTYQGYWKYCSEDDFAKCVFPFWFRHMIYWECTPDGDPEGRMWCSLTRNYNRDKVWKYCEGGETDQMRGGEGGVGGGGSRGE
ncbi:binder of sperm protein homolog 1 [Erinaceus europaeus]|uniref:Binder of sperm protein homolog 1 n=1 Tax=Erinaceus europaeus TaxID=9365 RepID=A0A1S3WVP4_ERIEU|nr:binder of sperm protein homolog 1 [Erinaceus europaeus]